MKSYNPAMRLSTHSLLREQPPNGVAFGDFFDEKRGGGERGTMYLRHVEQKRYKRHIHYIFISKFFFIFFSFFIVKSTHTNAEFHYSLRSISISENLYHKFMFLSLFVYTIKSYFSKIIHC